MNPSNSGYDFYRISAAGSAVIRAHATILHAVNVEISTGTVTLYNNASGTSSAVIGVFGGGAAVANTFVCDYNLNKGLYYVATGTPLMTLSVL